jgi:prolyl oligopeptidase
VSWRYRSALFDPGSLICATRVYAYSPLHALRAGTSYPASLILTGDHDDRVAPAHSYKFGAELQHDQASDAPVLLRVEAAVFTRRLSRSC